MWWAFHLRYTLGSDTTIHEHALEYEAPNKPAAYRALEAAHHGATAFVVRIERRGGDQRDKKAPKVEAWWSKT